MNKELVVKTESTGNPGKSVEIFDKIQNNRGISKKNMQSENSFRREIGCVLIIHQKFRKFEFFYSAQWKNWSDRYCD